MVWGDSGTVIIIVNSKSVLNAYSNDASSKVFASINRCDKDPMGSNMAKQ